MFVSFPFLLKPFGRAAGRYLLFILICIFVLNGTAIGAALYRYVDEDGNVGFTDDPSDRRYKYTPVTSYESEPKEAVKDSGEKKTPEPQKKGTKDAAEDPNAAERERMSKKVEELETIKGTTNNQQYREMLQNEIDLLNKQLKKISPFKAPDAVEKQGY